MINEYLDYIQENIFFNKKSMSYDLNQFQSGKYKKLFIMGLPGAGKTTISHQLEKKYKIPVYHTDDCSHKTLKHLKAKLPNKNIKKAKHIIQAHNMTPEQFWWKVYKDCIEPLIKSNKKMIIEGTLFSWYMRFPNIRAYLLQYPTIILGKSVVNSAIDRARREKESIIKKLYKELRDKSKLGGWIKTYTKDKTNHSNNIKEWDGTL